jgi:protein-L-isoaspartate O-methyltransferase
MKQNYTEQEFKEILSKIEPRAGWDFSRMNTISETAPWDYVEVVKQHLKPTDKVLDIGTGGGERFTQLAQYFRSGIGIDVDPVMVKTANENTSTVANLSFIYSDEDIQELPHDFDVILNRHAPFSLEAVKEHLKGDGQFITQQVGEQNMLNVKKALNLPIVQPPIDRVMLSANGLKIIDFREYNIEYIVKDIESLVFWLNALDMLHADIEGSAALKDVDTLNRVLRGNVTERGFVTNEQRYLAIAQKSANKKK